MGEGGWFKVHVIKSGQCHFLHLLSPSVHKLYLCKVVRPTVRDRVKEKKLFPQTFLPMNNDKECNYYMHLL